VTRPIPTIATIGAVGALALLPLTLHAQRPLSMAARSTVYAPHGIVATSQPLASAAGLAVLERGGNAIDAAVTAAAVLSVVEPMMTGVGGDMFAMVWIQKEHRLVALNASGRAGALMTRAELLRRGRTSMPVDGAETVTVPGALAGWAELLRKYGTITLAQAIAPAIRYAEEGFPVTPVIAADWNDQAAYLTRDPGARATFLNAAGHAPAAGEWFRNPDYARTLRAIAAGGPAVLYGGALGQRIVSRVRELGGFLTLDDLRRNQPTWVTPMSVPFKGYRVWELPPNNQGVAVLEMLRILEPYDLRAMGHNSARYLHHLIEAKKLAYADLARFVGDPDHLAMPADTLLSDRFIAERRSHLDSARAAAHAEPGPLLGSETIYLTAADSAGNMVSFINSLYDLFGSGVVAPGTGFALQNRGAGFALEEGLPNTVAPGKRPFHTLIPAFVTKDDQPYMSFGLMGGSMQAQGHVQLLLNLFVFGMELQPAIDAARFRHLGGTRVVLEPPVPDSVRAALSAMGHTIVTEERGQFGGSQAIIRLPRGYAAGSDPRKDGYAAGY
jgi:gamma-glutamyltranspeptidase / glutathione hydrolase